MRHSVSYLLLERVMERMAQLTFPIWGLEDDDRGESQVRARVGVRKTPGHGTASYQLVSKELRSHLKCWVDRTVKQGN